MMENSSIDYATGRGRETLMTLRKPIPWHLRFLLIVTRSDSLLQRYQDPLIELHKHLPRVEAAAAEAATAAATATAAT